MNNSTQVSQVKLKNTEVLLKLLYDLFPSSLPITSITIEDLRYLQGQQSVIRKIEELIEDT